MESKQTMIITGEQIKNMLLGAHKCFQRDYIMINDLNVFPVPDGDTGTNMLHTMDSVAKELVKLKNPTAGEAGSVAMRSAIMGARGNSGVILSQLLRGIGKGLAGKSEVTSNEIGKAFQFGVLYAYRAVSKPVEGTILTVARGMAKGAYHAVRKGEDFIEILEEVIEAGKEELKRTPELLPALKTAGVVDAGGQGLITFFEGCLAGFRGDEITTTDVNTVNADGVVKTIAANTGEVFDLRYPYCTEFVVYDAKVERNHVYECLKDMGDSLIIAVVDDIIKVHIHAEDPGAVLSHAITWGSLHDIKIDNMVDQHEGKATDRSITEPIVKKGLSVLSIAAGDGIADIMRNLGAGAIIMGGQSMNPSVEDFIDAIEKGTAEDYIILPNNKNIILAAEQVRKMLGVAHVSYVPTTNLAQGLMALIKFDPHKTIEENTTLMTAEAKTAKCISATIAVRDSVVNNITIKKDDYLGLVDDKIVATGKTLDAVIKSAIETLDEDYELASIYYGANLSEADAKAIAQEIETLDKDWEVEVFEGGQPLYPVIISLE